MFVSTTGSLSMLFALTGTFSMYHFKIFSCAFNISMNWEWGDKREKFNPYSLLIIFDPLAAKVGNDVENLQSA